MFHHMLYWAQLEIEEDTQPRATNIQIKLLKVRTTKN